MKLLCVSGLNQPIELYDWKLISAYDEAAHYPKVVQRIKEILKMVRNDSKEFHSHTELPHYAILAKQISLRKNIYLKNDD